MPYYVVSACLAGQYCRYDGGTSPCTFVSQLVKSDHALALCPEQLGGLPTPRFPCEIRQGQVYNVHRQDKTQAFIQGAQRALQLAQAQGCKAAILKSRSPSCGRDTIYDGSFTKKLILGQGIWASMLLHAGFTLFTEENLPYKIK